MAKRMIMTGVISIVLCGCFSGRQTGRESATTIQTVRDFSCANLMAIKGLSLGMTKEEVLSRLGDESVQSGSLVITNPYRSQATRGREIIFYYTRLKADDHQVTDDELTPLVFENGRLVEIGYCDPKDHPAE